MAGDIEALYQEVILDHYRRPHGKGSVDPADAQATVRNPLCGEEVTVSIALDRDAGTAEPRVREVRFLGQGCSISQASASMMTELARGRTPAELAAAASRFSAFLHGERSVAATEGLGPLSAFAGVSRVPVRIPCALLPWRALGQALGDRSR